MPTDPKRVQSLFLAAIDLPDPAARSGFLDHECGSDKVLRDRIELLLAAHREDSILATQADSAAPSGNYKLSVADFQVDDATQETLVPNDNSFDDATLGDPNSHGSLNTLDSTEPHVQSSHTNLGTVIAGRYTLLKVIGEGGMGSVFLASQSEPVKRNVALKLIKTGMDSKAVLARFDAERQALALMDHPNIARIYDGGVTPTGQPFFVMELVQGTPLTEYCDSKRLTVEGRLDLFVSVCHAVQHAHQKGIIHRDLKPGNVLVTEVDGRPAPKVIDFGVAKATEQKLTDMSFSDVGAIVGTPAYMSPEQADPTSMDIDTRTDVYALGVILYELLTGTPPIEAKQFQRGAILEMLRMVREVEPPRPSTRLSTADALPNIAANRGIEPAKLTRLLQNDLDWIVMKALEKDRTRRYDTANGMARDIQRYLADESVEARPPSLGYRLRKTIRRNKGLVTTISIVILALVGGIAVSSWQMVRANQARDAEEQQKQQAIAATSRAEAELKRSEDALALMESVFEGVDPMIESEIGTTYQSQMIDKLDQLDADLANSSVDPLVQARMLHSIGLTYLGLNEFNKAEQSLVRSLKVRRELLGSGNPQTLKSELLLAGAFTQTGRFQEGEEILQRLRALAVERYEDNHPSVFELDDKLGMLYHAADRHEQAIQLLERVRDWRKSRPSSDAADPTGELLTLHILAASYRDSGRVAESIELFEKVLTGRTKRFGADGSQTLTTCNSLAVAYAYAGRHDDAIWLHEQTRDRLLARFGPNHLIVFNAIANLATTLGRAGQPAKELSLLETTHEETLKRLGESSPATVQVALQLAVVYHNSGRAKDAIPLFERYLPILEKLYGKDQPRVVRSKKNLARSYKHNNEPEKARTLLESTVDELEKKLGPSNPETLRMRTDLAELGTEAKDRAKAIKQLEEILELQVKALGENHRDALATMEKLGGLYFAEERAKDAIAIHERAFPKFVASYGAEHPETLRVQDHLGASYWLNKQIDKAIPILEEALRKQEKVLGLDHPDSLHTALNLLTNYNSPEYREQTYELLRRWLPQFLKAFGPQHHTTGPMVPAFLRMAQQKERMHDGVPVLEYMYQHVLKEFGPDAEATLGQMNNLASSYWYAGRIDKSLPLLEDLVQRSRRALGEADPRTLSAIGSLARNYLDSGRPHEAVDLLDAALEKANSKSESSLEFLRRDLVVALARSGQRDRARPAIDAFVAETRRKESKTSSKYSAYLANMSQALLDLGDYVDAEELAREALVLREKQQPKSWQTANSRSLLGAALMGQKKYAEAEPLLLAGCEEFKQIEDSLAPLAVNRFAEAIDRLIAYYIAVDKPDEVQKWKDERAHYAQPVPQSKVTE